MKPGLSEQPVVNLLGFQLCWWLAVLLQAQSPPWLCLLLMLHLGLHGDRAIELRLILPGAAFGYLIDTLLLLTGVFRFAQDAALPPLWLALLWSCFCATLRQGLKPLHRRPWLAALLGAVGGSSSYLLGAQLGAVELGYSSSASLLILAPIWALLLPFLLWLSQRSERARHLQETL